MRLPRIPDAILAIFFVTAAVAFAIKIVQWGERDFAVRNVHRSQLNPMLVWEGH